MFENDLYHNIVWNKSVHLTDKVSINKEDQVYAYCDDHWVINRTVEPLYHIPETNV